jgi:hypothetical protein
MALNVRTGKKKTLQPDLRKSKENCRVFTCIESVALSSFGCLDWVKFLFFGFSDGFNMGGYVAVTVFPFQRRIRCGSAINAGGKFGTSLTSLAFINDGKAVAFVIAAALGCHEYAILAFSNSCTNHNRLPVFIVILFSH